VEAAGMTCQYMIDEPTAANNVLHLKMGLSLMLAWNNGHNRILKDGQVIYTADEPTGGTHFRCHRRAT
jgi:ethanolamine utilization protein EutJ